MPRLLHFAKGLTLAGMLAVGGISAAHAQDEAPVPPSLPPPLLSPPSLAESETFGDWALEVYKLPGREEALCVISRTYPEGNRLGFILGARGRSLLYGAPTLNLKEGLSLDFGFSVDGRPALGVPGQPYDPNTMMSTFLPATEGQALFEVFRKGKEAVIGSQALKFHTEPLPLEGAADAMTALDACAKDNNIQEIATAPALPAPATPATPAAPAPGASVSGSTFDGGGGSNGADRGLTDLALPGQAAAEPPVPGEQAAVAPPPAPAAPEAAPAPPSAADKAIKDAISAEAKKRKAGVGYAVAMPKEVTGDKLDDIVLLFVLLEGKERKGYVTVLKTTGPDKFTPLNTLALGGVPTNDPPVFTNTGMVISLVSSDPAKPREVEVLITAKALKLKK
jgi:hypothetical protein